MEPTNLYLKPSLAKRQKRRDKRLAEELIECYRGGMRGKKGKRGHKQRMAKNNFELALKKEGMKLMFNGGTKYQEDNLSPLARFLESRSGKHWDKVYSELSQQLDKNSTTGLHVFQHLWDYVTLYVELEEGKVWDLHGRELNSAWRRPRFYVHPISGVLTKAKYRT